MSRIQFDLPGHFVFSTQIQIYISHVNQGGHLDNAQLLTLVSEARVRFFKSLGYRESNVAGCPIVVGDLVAQYKSEGFHGETMRVRMLPQDFSRWLDCRHGEPRDVADLLQPAAEDYFEAIPVSDLVNKVANVGAELQAPVIPAPRKQKPAADKSDDGQMNLF